ncbi:sensor histidine kinase [Spirillospora sp. CA-294931]|uniref:sensor histidine kinase n=1 Tax=Spirillospora sp. CA-294931 TaxID=3240042 RepID=UPI003D8E3216
MVGKLWDWWRGKKILVDAAFTLPLAFLAVTDFLGTNVSDSFFGYLLLSLALIIPLALRRVVPRSVFAWIALVSFVQCLQGVGIVAANMAVLIALYTVVTGPSFRWGLAAAVTAELGAVMAAVRYAAGSPNETENTLLVLSLVVAGVWILGLHMRTRRAYLRSLEERAERLERERDAEVQIAMAAERARIARELHDVVAHNVSVMVVQADGASFAIETDTGRARQALETISTTGRQALAEMRRLLGVLREGDDAGLYAPQPGTNQLTELVDQIRGSGLALDFEVEGVPVELSEGRQLAVFRIVQESLTNTLKHGGPRASARVRLHYGDRMVEVSVTDDGRGAAAPDDGRGHGLVGMRERAAVYGGSVRTGPVPGGGYEVVARIPVREEVRA